jgi:hypothetical protein
VTTFPPPPPPGHAPPPQGYAPPAPPAYPGSQGTNGFAIASLVLALVGIQILAIVFGHVALAQIRRSGGAQRGRGLAIAGLVVGYALLAAGVLFVLAWAASGPE